MKKMCSLVDPWALEGGEKNMKRRYTGRDPLEMQSLYPEESTADLLCTPKLDG
mgnify:CR=1 FL=1